jgi:PPM family protein phosphatase
VSGALRLEWASATDTGRMRAGNEDAVVAGDELFAVADGMGGHVGGEVASNLALEAIQRSLGSDGLVAAVQAANRAILERAGKDPGLRGMGTTVCALALVEEDGTQRVEVVNVGDSRAYLFRDGALQQITEDHNLVAQLEREGRLTPEEARVHPQRNIITRVLGNDPDVEVDSFPVDPFRGDRFVLCSDGLFSELEDDEIAEILRSHPEAQAAVDELVRLANERGGRDNITVVLVDVVDDGDKAREASEALGPSTSSAPSRPVVKLDADAGRRRRRSDESDDVEEEPHGRRFTWRAALFVVVLAAIVLAAAGSIWWYGRNTYYVGVDGDRVAIFRGKPGGVLWIDPTVEQRTSLKMSDVPPARREDLRAGREEATLSAARRYVANLRDQADELKQSTTTTTTSTTIAAFFPPPSTAPAPGAAPP